VVGGYSTQSAVDNFTIARFVANGLALDTSSALGNTPFNGSTGYTLTNISNPNNAYTLSLQENGSFILAGSTTVGGDKLFATARYLGDQGIEGCMDITYNPAIGTSPGVPGFRTYPTVDAASSALQPQVVALQAMANNNLYVVTKQVATLVGSLIAQLDEDGVTELASIAIGQQSAADVVVDSQQRALIVGTSAISGGWLARTTSATDLTLDFTTIETTNSSSFTRVAEQSNGRIIVIGQYLTSTQGLLIGYDQTGALATNSTDVPFGTADVGYAIGDASTTFYDLLIDNDNGIYVAYKDTATIKIAKYLADGSSLSTTDFGTSGILNTGLAIGSYGAPSISFDSTGTRIMLTAARTTGDIAIQKITNATGTTILQNDFLQTSTLLTTPVITKLQCDTNNQSLINGYDTNDFFVIRCGAGVLTIDTTFAPYSSVPGILKTMYSTNNPSDTTIPARVSNGLCINYVGNILFGGYENIDSTTTVSLVGQVVGDTTTPATQVARFPSGIVGTVSGSVDLGTSGPLANGQPQTMYTIASGDFAGNTLVAMTDGTDTTLSMLDVDYALNTTFSTDGKITLTGLVSTNNIMVDVAGNIYVTGMSATDVVVYKVQPNGSAAAVINIPEATEIAGLTSIYGIAQQASGRILLAGYNSFSDFGSGSGVILSYNPVANEVDTSFNQSSTPGYRFTGVSHPITSISVATDADIEDKIYFAYQATDSTVAVARLLENGTDLDSQFTPVSASLTPTADSLVAMKLDVNGSIALVVQTSAGIVAARYNANGTTGGTYGIAAAVIIPAVAGLTLKEVLTLSDETTLILAQSGASSPYSLNLAQLSSDFVLNVGFNPFGTTPGILTTSVSPQVEFFAVDVVGSGAGIIVAGDTNATATSAVPYLTQITNDMIVTKVAQGATALGTSGYLDLTFNPAGTNPGFMNLNTVNTGLLSAIFPTLTIVKSLLQNDNGTYYIAGDNGTHTYMALMSSDDVQNTSFGESGLLTIEDQADLATMLLAENGGFYAVGGSGIAGSMDGWINYLNSSTGAAVSGFAPTVTLDVHFAIAQQPEGRLLVAGILDGVGTVIAYNSLTGVVDTTFGVDGYYTFTGYGAINSVVADLVGNVYIIANDAASNATVIALDADGTTVLWHEIVTGNSSLATTNYLSFNQVVNLVAVAVNTTLNTIVVKTYTLGTTGGTAATTLTFGASGIATELTAARVTSVSVDLNASPGKILLTGYDDLVTDVPFIIRTASTGLDTTFTSGSGTPGVVTTVTPSGVASQWYDLMINANGKITVAGYNTIASAVAPYMMRVYGDEFIGQYDPEVIEPLPTDLNPDFGIDGLAYTSVITDLLNGGSTVVDSQGRVLTGGVTTDNKFIIARFTSAGVLDTTFGTDGIAMSPAIATLVRTNGSYIALDVDNGVYIAGITSDFKLIVAKFLGTTGALDTAVFNYTAAYGVPAGITQSVAVANLNNGGYVAVDYLGHVLVGGSTSDLKLTVARFNSSGFQDATFSVDGVAQTGAIDNLRSGGFVATDIVVADADNSVYVGGSKTDSHLIVAQFDNTGSLLVSYGTSGIATTSVIENLADGGAIALNSDTKIVIGGYTNNKTFVAARFDVFGDLDTDFGTVGIATSNTLTSLESNPNIVVDSNNNVLLGGLFTAYDGVNKSMVVARFTTTGAIDTTFTSTGIASTGTIDDLQSGGFVGVNGVTNPFVGGYAGTKLVVAELFSGAEIFINDPAALTGGAFDVYWYGNNLALFRNFFATSFYALAITDSAARTDAINAVNISFDEYATVYADQPNLNLAASTTPGWDSHFDAVQASLIAAYSASTAQINTFFTDFNNRRTLVRDALLAFNNN